MDSFINGFETRYDRSFVDGRNILCMALIVLSLVYMRDSGLWTAIHYMAWAAFIGLGIWQISQYGFYWGLGLWFFNICLVVIVLLAVFLFAIMANMVSKAIIGD